MTTAIFMYVLALIKIFVTKIINIAITITMMMKIKTTTNTTKEERRPWQQQPYNNISISYKKMTTTI